MVCVCAYRSLRACRAASQPGGRERGVYLRAGEGCGRVAWCGLVGEQRARTRTLQARRGRSSFILLYFGDFIVKCTGTKCKKKKKNAPQKCAESLKTRFGFFPSPQLHTTKLAFAFAPLRLKRGVCLQKKFPRTRAAGGFVRATPRSRRAGAALPRRDKRGGKRASRGSEPSREHP